MFKAAEAARPCGELLKEYFEGRGSGQMNAGLLVFEAGGADVYNITAPFDLGGSKYIAGRVESREDEISKVWLFREQGAKWVKPIGSVEFNRLQDPFFTYIGEELILGGVQIDTDPMDDKKIINWRTLFFRGRSLNDLHLFASGPNHMKDIRLFEIEGGRIGVFTRPQGKVGGRGRIGYVELDSLDDLNDDTINRAKVFYTHFLPEEWGGANEVHRLKNGLYGVLGHIACFDDNQDSVHYYPMTFAFDAPSGTHTPVKIIACRSDFAPSPAKRERLADVVFSGGIVRKGNGRAVLYAGISDAAAQWLELPDPFDEYEKL